MPILLGFLTFKVKIALVSGARNQCQAKLDALVRIGCVFLGRDALYLIEQVGDSFYAAAPPALQNKIFLGDVHIERTQIPMLSAQEDF